jgi:hypothetical protein
MENEVKSAEQFVEQQLVEEFEKAKKEVAMVTDFVKEATEEVSAAIERCDDLRRWLTIATMYMCDARTALDKFMEDINGKETK